MLHVGRLALADERAIEHGVEHLLGVAIAIRQVEIIRADALAPFAEHEAHVAAFAGGYDQRMRGALALAIAVGSGIGKPRGDVEPAATTAPRWSAVVGQ